MRVDYYHTGNSKEERFSLDRVVIEPLPWAGNPSRPLDDTNLGKYFFEVVDAAERRDPLLARVQPRSTASGKRPPRRGSMNRTFSESLRFPARREARRASS